MTYGSSTCADMTWPMVRSARCWCAVHRRPLGTGTSASARAAFSRANGREQATNMCAGPTAPTATAVAPMTCSRSAASGFRRSRLKRPWRAIPTCSRRRWFLPPMKRAWSNRWRLWCSRTAPARAPGARSTMVSRRMSNTQSAPGNIRAGSSSSIRSRRLRPARSNGSSCANLQPHIRPRQVRANHDGSFASCMAVFRRRSSAVRRGACALGRIIEGAGSGRIGRQAGARMITLAFANSVATLTLSRPPVNAISDDVISLFETRLDEIDAHPDCKIVHLRSDQKVFCAGADLTQVRKRFNAPDGCERTYQYVSRLQRLYDRIEHLPQVTLAEIGGAAMGGGLELALACDLRIV